MPFIMHFNIPTKKANSPKIQLHIGKAKDLFLFKFFF